MVRMDHRSFGEGSLLCAADYDGFVDVSRVEDDADDVDRSAAADDDEGDAHHDGWNLHDLADFEWIGRLYFDEQPGWDWTAVLVEQAASGDSGCSDVREKEEITSTTIVRKEVSIVVAVGLVPILIDRSRGDLAVPPEIVKNGQFDRDAAADALRKFLEETVRAGKFQLTVTVRVLGAAVDGGTTTAREEEVIADLDGRDKEFLLERGAEALKALEHLAYRALRLEPAFHEKIHLDCGGYRALRFEELRMTARVAAERVQASKQPFRLNPMSSRERRIVHMALKEMPGVRTESVGVGEERQVVIHPAAAAGTEGAAGRT